MLRKYLWMTAAMGICLAGCQEDALVEEQTQTSGVTVEGEIVFSTSGLGSFNEENPQSRTVYGQGYATEDGKWNCPIDWVNGDQVRIYCAQASAPDVKYADYKVTWDGAGENDNVLENSKENGASLEKMTNRPLCWGEAVDHTFYGFYPSSAIQEGDSPKTIKATIPSFQRMTWSNDGGNWTGKPDMDYAFMRAEATVEASDRGKDVTLRFDALTTAVQVTLTASEQVSLSAIQILAESKDKTARQSVCGDFTMNLTTGDIDLTSDGTNNYQITVEARRKISSDDPSEPITLGAGQSLTFTAFLLPETNIQNLKIRVLGVGANGARVKTFANANLTKGSISKIELSDYAPSTGTNNWMEAIDDDVMISQLSIPGSVNAFSGEILSGSTGLSYVPETSETDLTQWISVESQFNRGARVFEIAVDRIGDLMDNVSINNACRESLENASLVAGKNTKDGLSLSNVFQTLASLVKGTDECAIVIPYYAPVNNESTRAWTCQLYNYLRKLETGISGVPVVPFDAKMKLGDARGKILVLTRLAGDNDDFHGWVQNITTVDYFLQRSSVIYNWDTEKDRWWNRGYDVHNPDQWVEVEGKNQYLWRGKEGYQPTGQQYIHERWGNKSSFLIKREGSSGYGDLYEPFVHVFDWERVCKASKTYEHHTLDIPVPPFGDNTYWYESKQEKENRTIDFTRKAITELRENPDTVCLYINSLRGYYIADADPRNTTGYNLSAIPYSVTVAPGAGRHGDVPSYTQDMNATMNEYIMNLEKDTKIQGERGPLGIMLMNFTGSGLDAPIGGMDMHGDDLLQTIIDNNFRFLLNTSKAE